MEIESLNSRQALRPFAILNLELFDDTNTSLNITAPAKLSIDIDPSLLSVAPAEVSMWYLDSETGLWIEDGTAIKEGNQYIADVTHFPMWACGLGYEVYELTGNITRQGAPYPNANLGLSISNFGHYRKFKAASDGSYLTYVLDVSDYDFAVFDNCNIAVFNTNIPAPSSDLVQDADVASTATSYEVSGIVYCDEVFNLISNSYVVLSFDNSDLTEIVLTDGAGAFNFYYDDCTNQGASIRAYNASTSSLSDPTTLTGTNTNLEIDVCETQVNSQMIFKVDGEPDYVIDEIDAPFGEITLETVDQVSWQTVASNPMVSTRGE